MNSINIYVDGSYNKDTNKTGAGVVIILEDGKVLEKAFPVPIEADHSWNINGECHAVLNALRIVSNEIILEEEIDIKDNNIIINYDYLGIEKWVTREWAAKSKIARLYVSEFTKLVNEHELKVTFNKVKAHSGNEFNDLADKLAKEGSEIK